MPIEGIIFDCDGTLVDSEMLTNEVLVEYGAQFGIRLTAAEAMAAFRGRKMDECVAELEALSGGALPEHFVPEFRSRMAAAFRERLRPVDGAVDLVRSLSIPFCVASSGPREKIELSLSLTGMLDHFHGRIFSSYEVGIWKPEPGLFLHAARAMGVAPERCAVVEDSLPGIRAGIAAGMTVIALLPEDREEMPEGVHRIGHLSEIGSLLARLDRTQSDDHPSRGSEAS